MHAASGGLIPCRTLADRGFPRFSQSPDCRLGSRADTTVQAVSSHPPLRCLSVSGHLFRNYFSVKRASTFEARALLDGPAVATACLGGCGQGQGLLRAHGLPDALLSLPWLCWPWAASPKCCSGASIPEGPHTEGEGDVEGGHQPLSEPGGWKGFGGSHGKGPPQLPTH